METRTFIASGAILPQRELTRMVDEVSDDVVGFGPIEFLLKNPMVTEVMVNGADDVFVYRRGGSRGRPTVYSKGEEAVVHLMGVVDGSSDSS